MTRIEAADCRFLLGAATFACLVMGGGTVRGVAIDALLQIFIICAATYTIIRLRKSQTSWLGVTLFVLVLCAGLVQVIPIPTELIHSLRPEIFLPYLPDSQMEQSLSTISLSTSRTLPAIIIVLSVISMFIAFSKLSERDIAGILPFYILGLVVIMIVLVLRYSNVISDKSDHYLGYFANLGLFANENHLSILLCASIPLLVYLAFFRTRSYFPVFLVAFVLLCLLAIGSRAGIQIGFAVLVMSIFVLARRARLAGSVILGLLITLVVYGYGAFVRIGGDEVQTGLERRDFALTTLRGIGDNWILGTGYGSFDLIYPHYERLEDVYSPYVNHAHNDVLEIVLEGGAMGAFIVLFYLMALLLRLARSQANQLQLLSFLSIGVILVHSTVDYPLRTMAVAASFAFFNAIFFARLSAVRPVLPSGTTEDHGQAGVAPG
ncbi:O-antigen ligase family protein [Rhizobium sp. CG5]|uniref:O-antigen ligase family protein n=1 Tax=Rhizobium sp. CG5 TaxID=2726076 RepID=UPI0020340F5A|nr:O-antigen ligase family protein [Rhizobium sp. CG5]MCM2476077.1 O-antigen ligase family protein [Rhizobium sp. CG5]